MTEPLVTITENDTLVCEGLLTPGSYPAEIVDEAIALVDDLRAFVPGAEQRWNVLKKLISRQEEGH